MKMKFLFFLKKIVQKSKHVEVWVDEIDKNKSYFDDDEIVRIVLVSEIKNFENLVSMVPKCEEI